MVALFFYVGYSKKRQIILITTNELSTFTIAFLLVTTSKPWLSYKKQEIFS